MDTKIEYNEFGPVNPCDEYKGDTVKKAQALLSCIRTGEMAVDENCNKLSASGYGVDKVIFCAGLWRVQRTFSDNITYIRDKNFVIGPQKAYSEKTKFEFYDAYSVHWNCYGFYKSENPDYVVAKYPIAGNVMVAYGKTIGEARAYLAIRLYDKFQDPIHAFLTKQNTK